MDRDPRAGSIGAWSIALGSMAGGAAGLVRASRGAVGTVHVILSSLAVVIGLLLLLRGLGRAPGPGSR